MNHNDISQFKQVILKPKTLQDALKVLYTIEIILMLLVFILIGNIYSYLKENLEIQSAFIFSLGMLSFISIFYSLLTQRDVQRKLNLTYEEIGKKEQEFTKAYDKKIKLAAELGLKKEYDEKMQSEREFFKRAKQMLSLELFLFMDVMLYISTSLLLVIKFNRLWIIMFTLTLGLMLTLHILSIWLLITSEQIRGWFSKK